MFVFVFVSGQADSWLWWSVPTIHWPCVVRSTLPFFQILWQHDCLDQELFEQRDTWCRHHTYIIMRRLYKSVTTLRLTRPSVDRDKYRSRLKKLAWQLGVMSSDGHWDIFLRALHKLLYVIASQSLSTIVWSDHHIRNWKLTHYQIWGANLWPQLTLKALGNG